SDQVAVGDLDLDGVPDLLATHPAADALTIERNTSLPAGFTDLGGLLAGVAGPPQLAGTGALVAGQLVRLKLTSAAPAAPVRLVLGLSAVNLPFKGGLLVPPAHLLLTRLLTHPTRH